MDRYIIKLTHCIQIYSVCNVLLVFVYGNGLFERYLPNNLIALCVLKFGVFISWSDFCDLKKYRKEANIAKTVVLIKFSK